VPDKLEAEPVTDPGAIPALHIELQHSNQAPVSAAIPSLSTNFTAHVGLQHNFKHSKGPDIIDRLINASLDIRLYNSLNNTLLASATLDLLPIGLGSTDFGNPSLPLQPVTSDDALKVLSAATSLICFLCLLWLYSNK